LFRFPDKGARPSDPRRLSAGRQRFFNMAKSRILFTSLAASMLWSCDQGTGPVTLPPLPCEDASELALPPVSMTVHKAPKKVRVSETTIPGMDWAKGDSVSAFFGGKDVRFVFTLDRQMYLVTYVSGTHSTTLLSQRDEGLDGAGGAINSRLCPAVRK